MLYFFRSEEPYFLDSRAAHSELGIPSETLTRQEMQRRFPMIDFDEVNYGLFEPGFGTLLARRAVQTLVASFVRDGGTYMQAEAIPVSPGSGPMTQLALSNGEAIEADRFIFAAGSWLPKLFPALLGRRIVATRQEVFYFAPPAGDPRFLPGAMPCWSDFNGGDMFYGFPDIESRGVKFAHDKHGPVTDPDTQDRRPSEAALAQVIAFRDRRFPLLKGAPLTESRVCQYENSSNGDFLIDFHPDHPNVLLVGGGSGHGFKHGPEVGRYAASLVTGGEQSEPRFSLATKTETHNREVH